MEGEKEKDRKCHDGKSEKSKRGFGRKNEEIVELLAAVMCKMQ